MNEENGELEVMEEISPNHVDLTLISLISKLPTPATVPLLVVKSDPVNSGLMDLNASSKSANQHDTKSGSTFEAKKYPDKFGVNKEKIVKKRATFSFPARRKRIFAVDGKKRKELPAPTIWLHREA
ncbi:unnamed protein product [Protopolystoma xenopodis]|uniref:Uncharacterized protein n=1 Tax=Protopolystoma xenopodis TaxID=117903 RepID=A0A448XL59_9PLAT|nr:unnamed protein product [Protopolystoma xenopodis]